MDETREKLFVDIWPGINGKRSYSRGWCVVWDTIEGEVRSASFATEQQAIDHMEEIQANDLKLSKLLSSAHIRYRHGRKNNNTFTRTNLRVEPEVEKSHGL